MKRLLTTLTIVLAAVAAPAATPAGPPLAAHQEPRGIGNLVAPGDRIQLVYTVDTAGVKSPEGSAYVRNDGQRGFTHLPLRLTKHVRPLVASVPASLIRGHELLYYAVVRDPQTGRSVTIPAAGARTPQSARILQKPVLVRLGVHRFGRVRAPGPVVAQVGASQVGWQTEGDNFGPQTFLVGRDRSIWLDDGLNNRLLVFRPGAPKSVARTVPLPDRSGDSDVALGPAGSVYVTGGVGVGVNHRNVLYRLSASGKVLWRSFLAGERDGSFLVGANSPIRLGPDGTLYALAGMPGRPGGQNAWMPVATPDGRPIAAAQQIARAHWPDQPVAGGLRLVSETYTAQADKAPHEARFALLDRRGRVVRAWRVVSRTDINFGYATPEVIGGDPVVVLDVTAQSKAGFKWEELVLRLGPTGTRARFSLRHAVFGDNILADVRIGPDGNVYQLASSPQTGVTISRYSLR
jgi:hypothetical protein